MGALGQSISGLAQSGPNHSGPRQASLIHAAGPEKACERPRAILSSGVRFMICPVSKLLISGEPGTLQSPVRRPSPPAAPTGTPNLGCIRLLLVMVSPPPRCSSLPQTTLAAHLRCDLLDTLPPPSACVRCACSQQAEDLANRVGECSTSREAACVAALESGAQKI